MATDESRTGYEDRYREKETERPSRRLGVEGEHLGYGVIPADFISTLQARTMAASIAVDRSFLKVSAVGPLPVASLPMCIVAIDGAFARMLLSVRSIS